MRIKFLIVLALFPAMLSAQELVTVKGRVVNEQGENVEYVQLGMPRRQIGVISTADGRFEIEVPCDTLEFFHVSYRKASFPVTGAADDVVIVLQGQELEPAVFIGGNTKEKYLMRPGTAALKNLGVITTAPDGEHPKGRELGSVAKAAKPFLVKDILFSVLSNHIPGCVASINIYRIEGKKESFVDVLHKPIYFDVPVSDEQQSFDIQPEEAILLEPGRYFIAFQIVGYDMQATITPDMTMNFSIYLKNSYLRETALGEMKPFPVNIGIAVKGLEYQ